ncbi:MAG: cysteine synthase A, partial [Oligoflexales bacterium]|nr:cysteine synthase A [Oligoflexales bacterium]
RFENIVGDTKIYAKLEYFNPMSSVKDRIAASMIEDAERKGLIDRETLLIEPTSGNTGIGLAFVAAVKGYRILLTMPETMSVERRSLLKSLGATIVLTEGSKGMAGAVAEANRLHGETPNSFILNQFGNPANPEVHRRTTAREIIRDTEGKIDAFVAGVGTGGTITGVGEILKKEIPGIKVYAVEPLASPVLSGGSPGVHRLQGIGAGFVPEILNREIYDEVIKVSNEDAIESVKQLACREGLLVGLSAGAAFHATLELGKREQYKGKTLLTIFPDSGERYLSLNLF